MPKAQVLPILFDSSYFTLFAYPLFMGLSWGVAYYLSKHIFVKHRQSPAPLLALFIVLFISAWIGAKVFFLAFSAETKFQQYIANDNFWLGGGFVFYGGLIFGLATFFIFSCILKKFPFGHSKFLAPGLAIGHAIGRLGCFFAGCCYGSQCELPWALRMHGEFRHPVQIYEAAGLLVLAGLTLKWLKSEKDNIFVVTGYLMFYSVLRFVVEFFRGDQVRGVLRSGLSTSQLISLVIFFIAFAIGFFIKAGTKAPKSRQ